MDKDLIFQNIGEHEDLWSRLQEYADELNLQPEDEGIFTTEDQARVSWYTNNYLHNYVAVGTHLARVKKIRTQLGNKKERIFGKLYVAETERCVSGRNSSKYDKEYRTGKVTVDPEYRKTIKLLSEVQELEDRLQVAKDGLHMKSLILPTLFKLDKYNF